MTVFNDSAFFERTLRGRFREKEAITLFHGSKQPHEINTWKNNVSQSKLERSNEIVLELQPLINNEYLLTIISNNKY